MVQMFCLQHVSISLMELMLTHHKTSYNTIVIGQIWQKNDSKKRCHYFLETYCLKKLYIEKKSCKRFLIFPNSKN